MHNTDDHQSTFRELMQMYMKENFEDWKNNDQRNNHFIFSETHLMNVLIAHFLIKMEEDYYSQETDECNLEEIEKHLDLLIHDSQHAFEETIDMIEKIINQSES